ncbi:MAG: DUF3990 domain-containing protein [Bacteroidales bacterium]|nr:DUF3990 domain-containing protein [Bacteroidales bacterium]
MKLYHTSTIRIEHPDIKHSRKHLDFGPGFYTTLLLDQAEKYGERFLRRGEPAVINIYELDEDLDHYTRLVFNSYDAEWLDFVSSCRKGLPHAEYDIIEGGVADDKVFNAIDLYFSGIYTKEQALDQLRYKKPNYQICIASQDVLDNHLHYVMSQEL